MKIKGITVKLYNNIKTGTDTMGNDTYEPTAIEVSNVLVSPASTDDITNSLNLHGKKAVYTLAIPKGNTNIWEDAKVEFFGQTFRTYGYTVVGIDENIPLSWNAKVWCEVYG